MTVDGIIGLILCIPMGLLLLLAETAFVILDIRREFFK